MRDVVIVAVLRHVSDTYECRRGCAAVSTDGQVHMTAGTRVRAAVTTAGQVHMTAGTCVRAAVSTDGQVHMTAYALVLQ
eukprot:COSAG06_NODE_4336_length_4357_cov_18.576092_3_plen_79_part_00